jgi:hypothetical protein
LHLKLGKSEIVQEFLGVTERFRWGDTRYFIVAVKKVNSPLKSNNE